MPRRRGVERLEIAGLLVDLVAEHPSEEINGGAPAARRSAARAGCCLGPAGTVERLEDRVVRAGDEVPDGAEAEPGLGEQPAILQQQPLQVLSHE